MRTELWVWEMVTVQKKLYMKHGRIDHAKEFGIDFCRAIKFGNASQLVGTTLMRSGIKLIPTLTATALVGMVASTQTDKLTWAQAMYPILFPPALVATGAAIKFIPTILNKKKLSFAEANDMNLMEDYRKSHEDTYLKHLWERVFSYETDLHHTKEEQTQHVNHYQTKLEIVDRHVNRLLKELQDHEDTQVNGNLEELVQVNMQALSKAKNIPLTEKEFIDRAHYALELHLPQTTQLEQLGVQLGGLENFLDGAPLHQSMDKLMQEYENDATLRRIKNSLSKQGEKLNFNVHKKAQQKIWYAFAIKQVAIKVGRVLNELHEEYPHAPLNAQVILWPEAEKNTLYDTYSDLSEKIHEKRIALIHEIFGPTLESADRMIDRMILCNFELATELRLKYDVEYIQDELRKGFRDDLISVDCQEQVIEDQEKYLYDSRKKINAFDSYLQSCYPQLFEFEAQEELRAVRIAYHTNYGVEKNKVYLRTRHGLKDYFAMCDTKKGEQANQYIDSLIQEVRENADIFTNDLIAIRQFQQLSIIEMQETRELVFSLGEYTNGNGA